MKFDAEIEIGAPRDEVWKVLVDIERWPVWTKSMQELTWLGDSGMRIGNRARVKQPKLPTLVWEVTELEPGISFSWRSKKSGVSSIGRHVLERDGPDRTSVNLGLDQFGPLAKVAEAFGGKRAVRYIEMECEGLKRYCEQQHT